MKKLLFLSGLRFPISFIVINLMISQIGFCQDCKTQAANKPYTSVRFPDVFVAAASSERKPASWNITKMKPQLAKVESWVKNILAGFTGAKLAYSNNYFLDYELGEDQTEKFYKATGIKGYYEAVMRFYAYYCYDNNNNIYTESECGSFIYVAFNNVFAAELCTDVGVFTVNGKPVFKVFQKSRSEGRIDFYEQRAKSDVNDNIYTSKHDFIIIRNSDKPVFGSITRKEYLEQMSRDIEAYKAKQKDFLTGNYNLQVKQFEEEMRTYKTMDKSYTPEKEAKRRKWFNEDNNPEKLDKDIKKLENDANDANKAIAEYLGKSQEWLSRSFGNFYPNSSYTAKGVKQFFDNLDNFTESNEDNTRTEIVSINPAYYNKTLGNDVPQLISVHLAKGSYPHMLKVADLVKKHGALAPLEAILNPGKTPSPDLAPPELISTYTLKYLPKLIKLEPLTVPPGVKPSAVSVINYNNNAPTAKLNFEIPVRSPKLDQLTQPLTTESYKTYLQQLYTAISNSIKPDEKKKADDHIKNNKLTQSKDISHTAFAVWLQNAPEASLYLYGKAVLTNPFDTLAANNFSAFLIMGGMAEKSIPILEFWNKQKPGDATLLCNLGNAYYRLGDINSAMKYLQQCVQHDTLSPTANKILSLIHLKKGDTKKAEEYATKSITSSYDEQVIAILHQLNNKTKVGEIMGRLQDKEFPVLKRTMLPAMPSKLDDMEKFLIELEAENESVSKTIEDIKAKTPKPDDDVLQKQMMKGFVRGIPLIQLKAQAIIMDGMQIYQRASVQESDVFNYNYKNLVTPYTANCKSIIRKYTDQLNKLEGGEAGDEDKIAALELAKCNELNAATEKYLGGLSQLVNGYAQRQEFIARKFYRDFANWAPYWMPGTNYFPSIEREYLEDVSEILSAYKIVSKSNCSTFEPLAKKNGVLKPWEDEYCANFKGKIKFGVMKTTWTCNSIGVEGGEGVVGEFEMRFRDDGTLEDFTIGGGPGASWHTGDEKVLKLEASASAKEFLKIGPNRTTGKWEIKDFGAKLESSIEGSFGEISVEVKLIEVSVAVNAGFEAGGVVPAIFNLK